MLHWRHMEKLSVGGSIRAGWDIFKKRPLIIIGAFVVAFLVSAISSALLDPEKGAPVTTATTLMSIASAIIGIFVELGLLSFTIKAHDNVEGVKIADLWNPNVFLKYLGAQIIVGLTVVIGLILLVVPGVIAALGLMFTSYLVIDKGRGPVEAYKESWQMTKGHKWQLFLLVLAILGINILGLIALVVGLLATIPVSMLAMVHAYRKLSGVAPVQAA